MNVVEKDDLIQLYIVQKKTMKETAKELNVAVGTVFNYIKKYDIKPRTQKEAFLVSKEKGWTYPESARKRISKAHKGKIVSEETRRKMSENARTGEIFNSVKGAAEKYNVAATNISKACRDNKKIKKCYWKYIEEV